MLDDKKITELVTVIRNAYRGYPKSDSTVDEMIAQALRTGYVRGTAEVRTP